MVTYFLTSSDTDGGAMWTRTTDLVIIFLRYT